MGFNIESWTILSSVEQSIKDKVEKVGTTLKKWNVNIYRGILTGRNDVFIINEETKNNLVKASSKNDEIIRPIFKGRNIKKYKTEASNLWLINTHNGLKKNNINRIDVINNYPHIYSYLKEYEAELVKRQDKGDHWTNLRNCAYLEEFEKEKIIWLEITDLPKFAYDNKSLMVEATAFMMTGSNLKYLIAFLNSKLSQWYFDKITISSGAGTNRWKKMYIEAIPIPKISQNDEDVFNKLVDNILLRKENNESSIEIENQIDDLVFNLFNLAESEVKLIIDSLSKSKP